MKATLRVLFVTGSLGCAQPDMVPTTAPSPTASPSADDDERAADPPEQAEPRRFSSLPAPTFVDPERGAKVKATFGELRTFAESFRLAQMREFAALARDRLGACRLGAVEARGAHAARYAIDCDRVPALLELAVDPSGDPRITGYRIVPRPRVGHCAVQ